MRLLSGPLLCRMGQISLCAALALGLGLAMPAWAQTAQPQAVASHDAEPASDRLAQWWQALQRLCQKSYAGRLIDPQARDADLVGKPLVMHVRQCGDDEIKIPFHVGDDRSRTWVLTRTARGIRLKHDHRHADGSEDALTQYGGESLATGSAQQLAFAADAHTARILPAAASNVWTITVSEKSLGYSLRRTGADRRFDVEFDLTQTVPNPPAPWGHP